MEIKTKAHRWGSSFAVILPKFVVETKKIRENDELIIEIKNRSLAGELFGKFPRHSKKTAQEIKSEIRQGWLSKSDIQKEKIWKDHR